MVDPQMISALKGESPAVQGLFGVPDMQLNNLSGKNGMSKEFYLIRHGSTKLNKQNGGVDKIRGWANVPLSEQGREEIQELGKKLANSGLKILVHSDLDRARDTAQAIANTTGAQMVPSPLLRPWNVGIFTGKDSNAAHPELVKLAEKNPDEPIPQGESFNQFKTRAFDGLRQALVDAKDNPLGVVTHHRVERLYNAWLAAGQPPDYSIDFDTMFKHGEDPAVAKRVSVDISKLFPTSNARPIPNGSGPPGAG